MNTQPKFWCALAALASLPVFVGGCSQEVGQPTGTAVEPLAGGVPNTGDSEGRATQMPAFFNGTPITVNLVEFPSGAEASFLAQLNNGHGTTNLIFAGADLDKTQPFPPVVNEIQGRGFNPRWQQILITPAIAFTSETDILSAACATVAAIPTSGMVTPNVPNCTPTITLDVTTEFYRCSIVGTPAAG